MAYGIRVFNPDGSLQFDTSNRLFRTLLTTSIGTTNGSVLVLGASQQGTVSVALSGEAPVKPKVTVSGNAVSWNYGSSPANLRGPATLTVMAY